MTARAAATLLAVVGETERPMLMRAAALLSRHLTEAAGTPVAFDNTFATSLAEAAGGDGAIVIVSLLPELDRIDEPWPAAEQRLRAACRAITQDPRRTLFLCTVLRHVAPGDDAERRRVRIRRLNLLAVELSRETGLHVIDLDRALADIGARVLATDYRLGGDHAAEAAAGCIALTLLSVGLDQYAPYAAQAAARDAIAARPAPWAGAKLDMVRRDVIAIGTGRRRQHISAVVDSAQAQHAGWLLRCVLTGRIGLSDALGRLLFAISQRGLRGSLGILLAAARTLPRGGTGNAVPSHK